MSEVPLYPESYMNRGIRRKYVKESQSTGFDLSAAFKTSHNLIVFQQHIS